VPRHRNIKTIGTIFELDFDFFSDFDLRGGFDGLEGKGFGAEEGFFWLEDNESGVAGFGLIGVLSGFGLVLFSGAGEVLSFVFSRFD